MVHEIHPTIFNCIGNLKYETLYQRPFYCEEFLLLEKSQKKYSAIQHVDKAHTPAVLTRIFRIF